MQDTSPPSGAASNDGARPAAPMTTSSAGGQGGTLWLFTITTFVSGVISTGDRYQGQKAEKNEPNHDLWVRHVHCSLQLRTATCRFPPDHRTTKTPQQESPSRQLSAPAGVVRSFYLRIAGSDSVVENTAFKLLPIDGSGEIKR